MKKSLYSQQHAVLTQMLRELRENAGIGQEQLATLLDDVQPMISRYENGQRRLDLVELNSICTACNSDLSSFVDTFLKRLQSEGVL